MKQSMKRIYPCSKNSKNGPKIFQGKEQKKVLTMINCLYGAAVQAAMITNI